MINRNFFHIHKGITSLLVHVSGYRRGQQTGDSDSDDKKEDADVCGM